MMKPIFPETDTQIFLSEDYGAYFSPASPSGERSHQLVVTFTALVNEANPERHGLSQASLRTAGIDAIHIFPRLNHWYQSSDIFRILDATAKVSSAYQERITYGLSMGGFAALQASGILDATRTVTWAPQFTVDQTKVSFPAGWQNLVKGVEFLWDDFDVNVSHTAEHWVAFDPRHKDRMQIAEISQRVSIRPFLLPFGGHHVWLEFIHAGLGAAALLAFIRDDREDLKALRIKMRAARRTSVRYWVRLAEESPRWRSEALLRAHALSPDHKELVAAMKRFEWMPPSPTTSN